MRPASLAMALADYLPTILYLLGCWHLVRLMRGMGARELAGMFMAGSLLAFASGVLKAGSKLADALAARPVTESGFLYDHMFPTMAAGFLATAAAMILAARRYSGRDAVGERTRFAETAAWASPFLGGLFLGLAFGLVLAADYAAPSLRPHLLGLKRWSMAAMVVLQLATVGILAWFAFRERAPAAGIAAVASILCMLAMGALGSPSSSAAFGDRALFNWIDQTVNTAAQGTFLAAAAIMRKRAEAGTIVGIRRTRRAS